MKKIRSFFKWNKISDLWKQERYINLGTVEDPFAHFYWNKNPKYTYITLNNEGEIEWKYKFEFGNWVKHYCLEGVVCYVEVPEGEAKYIHNNLSSKSGYYYVNDELQTTRKKWPTGVYKVRLVLTNPAANYALTFMNPLQALGIYVGKNVRMTQTFGNSAKICKEIVFSDTQSILVFPKNLDNLKLLIIPSNITQITNGISNNPNFVQNIFKIKVQNNNNFYLDNSIFISKYNKALYFSRTGIIPNDIDIVTVGALYGHIDVLTLPENLKKISSQNIETINTLNLNSKYLQCSTSLGVSQIKTINISENVQIIDDNLFRNTQGYTTITIPDNVTSIGYSSFGGNHDLQSIYIGKNATFRRGGSMAVGILVGHPSLERIIVSEENETLKSVNDNTLLIRRNSTDEFSTLAVGTKNTQIPSNVKVLMIDCFRNSNIENIIVPENVTVLEETCFAYNDLLQTVTLGKNVEQIGYNAFANCPVLTSLTLFATTPPVISSELCQDSPNVIIYVPEESINTYKTNKQWKKYANLIQPITNTI